MPERRRRAARTAGGRRGRQSHGGRRPSRESVLRARAETAEARHHQRGRAPQRRADLPAGRDRPGTGAIESLRGHGGPVSGSRRGLVESTGGHIPMSELVLRENRDGAAILTLNRPEKLNALSKDMIEALDAHVNSLARETKTIGLVILRGAGGNFSSGHDMSEVLSQVKAHAKPHHYVEVIDRVGNLPQPVISAVQGHCSTGALELALAADLLVAAESACFTDAYARWGLTPIWGLSLRLPHRIGTSKAS